jgi:hypothetical protein
MDPIQDQASNPVARMRQALLQGVPGFTRQPGVAQPHLGLQPSMVSMGGGGPSITPPANPAFASPGAIGKDQSRVPQGVMSPAQAASGLTAGAPPALNTGAWPVQHPQMPIGFAP